MTLLQKLRICLNYCLEQIENSNNEILADVSVDNMLEIIDFIDTLKKFAMNERRLQVIKDAALIGSVMFIWLIAINLIQRPMAAFYFDFFDPSNQGRVAFHASV